MKRIKIILVGLLALLAIREVVGLLQWFVIEGKTWAEYRELTAQDVKRELTNEVRSIRNLITRKGI